MHLAQRLSKLRDFDCIPLERAARYLVGKPKAALRFRRQEYVDKVNFACDPFSRESTVGSVAQIGHHTVKSESALQRLTALSVREAEFNADAKGGQVGLSFGPHIRESWNSNDGLTYKVTVIRRIL